jgi:hypothetical protein
MVKGDMRKYDHLVKKKCIAFYSPCDTNKKGKHVRVKRCKQYSMAYRR